MKAHCWGMVLLLVILAAGCSTSSPSGTSSPDEAEVAVPADVERWKRHVSAACMRSLTQFEAAQAATYQVRSMVDVADNMDEVAPVMRDFHRALADIRPPRHGRDEARQVVRMVRRLADEVEVMQAAAHFNDPASLEAATLDFQSLTRDLHDVLDDLDLQACI